MPRTVSITLELTPRQAEALADAIEFGTDEVEEDFEDTLQQTANRIRDAAEKAR